MYKGIPISLEEEETTRYELLRYCKVPLRNIERR